MSTLTSVLFVGGESRRMGVDKATLIVQGEPLWQRQIRTLRNLLPDKVLLSARVRPSWCPDEIEAVLDQPPSRGPLSGLLAALNVVETTHLLALAVDLPQMTSAHLRELWVLATPGVGVVPQAGDFFEPLCAVYPAESLLIARECIAGSDVSLQSFIQKLSDDSRMRPRRLAEKELLLYRNANTLADLHAS